MFLRTKLSSFSFVLLIFLTKRSLSQLSIEGIQNNAAILDANIDVYLGMNNLSDGPYSIKINIGGNLIVSASWYYKSVQENYLFFSLPDLFEGTYFMDVQMYGLHVELTESITFHVWNTFYDTDLTYAAANEVVPFGILKDGEYNSKTYSSIACMGGVQPYPFKLHSAGFKDDGYGPDAIGQRVCRFSHVCWARGQLIYFKDPQTVNFSSWPISHRHGFLHLSYLDVNRNQDDLENVKAWSPFVMHESVPRWFQTLDVDLSFLDAPSFGDNFGHFIMDNVVSIMQAASAFGHESLIDSQVLLLSKCRLPGSLDGTSRAGNCRKNYNELMRVFFHRPVLHLDELSSSNGICFRNLIAGHASAFSLRFQYPRSSVLRVFRDYTYRQLGLKLPQLETKEAGAWRVPSLLACYKVARGAMNPPHWPSACEDVRVILAQFSTPIDSTCINPASLPLTGQVMTSQTAGTS
uniref:Uncharacterized protein n=1 Tax=Guillardia theta TaxID=55529 RepID=A0A7S4H8E4_GUITH|mmetsp:Transcript_10229/g.34116  ORF Transcript_10229/g.34116 Transcript_10229/m.34116 type:complete len:464 (+) Transcript_10229:77-1468(+)